MKNHISESKPAFRTIGAAILLTAIGFLVYANALDAPFMFDDLPNITQNPLIRMTRLTPGYLGGILKHQLGNRPLAYTTFAINYYLDQYDVRGYHLFNVVIHIFTALLIFLVTRQTLRLCSSENGLIPFFTAALWLVNPLHTQSVTYIVQRMNSMAAMFYMLALFCYITARMNAGAGGIRLKRFLLYALCLLAAILGLASKQIVITLPVFLFLYEWFFFQNLDRTWLKKQLPGISLTILVIIALVILLGIPALDKISEMYQKNAFSMGQRLLTQPGVIVYYISLLFYPHPARLNVDYDFPLATLSADPGVILISLMAIAALLVAALHKPGRHHLISFALLWFLGNLVIESSVIGLAILFEHRTYLPSIFPAILLVTLFVRHTPRPVAVMVLCLAVAVSSFWTYQRNNVWGDTLSLWQDCARKTPLQARPANGVGMAYQTHQQPEKAIEWFQKAVKLDPDYDEAYSNIGGILVKQDKYVEAVPYLEHAVTLDPENHEAFSNLGAAMQRLNRLDEAAYFLSKSISLYPDYEIAQNNLGAVLTDKGDIDGAIRHLKRAINLNPEYAEAYNNLGVALMRQGRIQEAIDDYQEALRLDPENANAHFNLGTAWFQQQDMDRARHHLEQALRLDPDAVLTLNNLVSVLVIQKKYKAAIDALTRLTVLLPGSPTVYYNLACVYALQGEKEAAVNALQKAVDLGYDRWNHIKTDPDLKNIHNTDYFTRLMRRHNM